MVSYLVPGGMVELLFLDQARSCVLTGEAMKGQRHTNNKGLQQIKRGKTYSQVKRMARRLKLPFNKPAPVLAASQNIAERDPSVMPDCAGAGAPVGGSNNG